MDIQGRTITIIGAQRSGMAAAQLVVRLGGIAKLSDQGDDQAFSPVFKKWAAEHAIDIECGGHTREFIQKSDLLVLSPGVCHDADPVRWAIEKNIPVLGEVEFASQFCEKPIIAVTGSNGKTTVSTLIHHALQRAGHTSCLCGNVGYPFSEFVLDSADKDYIVLEVSSFQLESLMDPASSFRTVSSDDAWHIKGFQPSIAVFLNFSQNHLDRHKDLDEYFEAKIKIFLNQDSQDYMVLNAQDPKVRGLVRQAQSQSVFFNAVEENEENRNSNFSAVLAVGRILGLDENCLFTVFEEFKGVEHRLESVRFLDGVRWVNDSKATTVEAALWALESVDQPVIMICGGRDKNMDFSVLRETARHKIKKMFVIGEARSKIRQAFQDIISIEECASLEEAVGKARQTACNGDCVLLSPMCASFDMFRDYEERGRIFKGIVEQLVQV